MTQADLEKRAYKLGRQDARQGRVFRHSADPGSWIRRYLSYYDMGWFEARQ